MSVSAPRNSLSETVQASRPCPAGASVIFSGRMPSMWSGAKPASANDAATGTLLGTITGITWTTSGNPASLAGSTPDDDADASGTAGWGRFRDAGDTLRMDGTVGADFTLADPNIVAGGQISLTSATLTQPSGE